MDRKALIEEMEKLAKPALAKDPKDRTYRDRYYIWEYERVLNPRKYLTDYNEGEEVCIWDGTKLANNEIKDGFGEDFPQWFRDCGKHFGQKVKNKADGKVYTLVGMSYTYLDYYYILESNNKKHYCSCVGGIKFLL